MLKVKQNITRFLTAAIGLAVIITALVVVLFAPIKVNAAAINNDTDLQNAITAAGNTPTTLTITNSFNLTQTSVNIASGQDITLTGGATLTRTAAVPYDSVVGVFTVANGGSLTLENITIQGASGGFNAGNALVRVNSGGRLTMEQGAVLRDNVAYDNSTIDKNGGGVLVNGGTFIMNGGLITRTRAVKGGGVYVSNNGTFTMNGGEISGNWVIPATNSGINGGGVYVESGTFTISGAAIITGNRMINPTTGDLSNVYLANNRYITVNNPASGMNIGVTTATADGVIVNSGAMASHAGYFSADDGSGVVYGMMNGAAQLRIGGTAYTVTYSGNGNTGGAIPTGPVPYFSGNVSVLGNTGNLVKTGFTFAGWNTANDGSGTDYAAGAIFTITGNITLYALWDCAHTAASAANCTVCATCGMSTGTAHAVRIYGGNCNTAVLCGNNGTCAVQVLPAESGHVPGSDDGDCTTAIECSRAGCTQVATAALSHSFTSYSATVAAACETEGSETASCGNFGCTKTDTREINALGHDWTAWIQVSTTDEWQRTCQRLGCTAEESTFVGGTPDPACTHAFTGAAMLITPATCTAEGEETVTCAGTVATCEAIITQTIPKIPHTESAQITIPATCEADGSTRTECTVCGYELSASVITMLGHDFGTAKNDGTHECNRANCTVTETCSPNAPGDTCLICGYLTPLSNNSGNGDGSSYGGESGSGGSSSGGTRPAVRPTPPPPTAIAIEDEDGEIEPPSPYGAYDTHIFMTIGSTAFNINNQIFYMDIPPLIVDGRTMVPLRVIAEAFGAAVSWDDATKTVTVELDGEVLTITIGLLADGMDVPAFIQDGRTMVPLRYISETLGALIEWNSDTRTVDIYY